MAKILDVPYRSQWDSDGSLSTTDCGPACLAMVLDYYGHHASINELYHATGAEPGQYIGFGQLQRVARTHGLTFNYGENYELNDLKRWIEEGKPVIALVKYSAWSQIEPGVSTQDIFSGPHFVVVVGYGDGNIYINDPNYWPPRRQEGHRKTWSEVLFNLAWSNVRTPGIPNPNNAVIVPTVGKVQDEDLSLETGDMPGMVEFTVQPQNVVEYTVQPGDTWAGIAGKFYGDQTRYPEILAFNNLSAGAPLYVNKKLRIPVRETEAVPPDQPIILGEGAIQTVDADLLRRLKETWVSEGKLATSADEITALRAFVDEIKRWDVSETPAITYMVQPGDTWSSIAGKFYGDQMRYQEIIEFNQLPPGAPLYAGQKLRIPPT
jgi:nucleoid-associated protein YgaU